MGRLLPAHSFRDTKRRAEAGNIIICIGHDELPDNQSVAVGCFHRCNGTAVDSMDLCERRSHNGRWSDVDRRRSTGPAQEQRSQQYPIGVFSAYLHLPSSSLTHDTVLSA